MLDEWHGGRLMASTCICIVKGGRMAMRIGYHERPLKGTPCLLY